MIKLLLIKDIKLLLRDLKFQIFFAILTALFILSAVSSASVYKSHSLEYQKLLAKHQENVHSEVDMNLDRLISIYSVGITVVDVPTPALLFSGYENYNNQLTNKIMFYYPSFESYDNSKANAFRLNWFFILGILSGFIMLIMSFEAISSEKRAGTFRLLSIYGFKRQAVLWCKYLSDMILYLIITIPPALISIILFFALTGTWEASYMMQFLLIILLSIPFASFFILLGIFISMSKNYRNAIVMIVFVWLLFVIIIPNSANIFGKLISPVKTSSQYKQRSDVAWQTEWDAWMEETKGATGGNALESMQNGLRAKAVYAADEKANQVNQQELEDSRRQLKTMEMIASLSPFTQFEKISEIVFNKGYYLQEFQQEAVRTNIAQLRNLMIEQDAKDETSLHLFYGWAPYDGGYVGTLGFTPFSNQRFDYPDMLFVTKIPTDDAVGKALKILIKLLPILLLNLILIVCSVVKLEKLDIR